MENTEPERRVVERLFEAMAAGPDGEEPMMALFADEAVLVEPFTGRRREHVGKASIRAAYRDLFSEPPPPGMRLTLHRVDRNGGQVRAEWSCTASTYLEDRVGFDLFTVGHGKIQRLEIIITQPERLKEDAS